MSKNSLSKDKCKVCYELDKSCCKTQPLFSNEELAKVYYETRVFADNNIKILPVGSSNYVVTLQEWHVDNATSFDIDSRDCLFLENGECSVYEYRPSVCRDYGVKDVLPCYAKEFAVEELLGMNNSVLDEYVKKANDKIKSFKIKLLNNNTIISNMFNLGLKNYNNDIPKKDMNELNLNMLIYYIMHNMEYIQYDKIIYKDLVRLKYKYELVTVSNGSNKMINAIRNNIMESDNAYYKHYVNIHKRISKYLMTKPYSYHKIIVDKINTLFKDLDSKEIPVELNNKLFYKDELDKQHLINLTITLLGIYKIQYMLKKPIKYVNKYLMKKNHDTRMMEYILDIKTLRMLIYANIDRLVHGENSDKYVVNDIFKDIDDISLFSIKLKAGTEMELFEYMLDIVDDRIDLLINNIKKG